MKAVRKQAERGRVKPESGCLPAELDRETGQSGSGKLERRVLVKRASKAIMSCEPVGWDGRRRGNLKPEAQTAKLGSREGQVERVRAPRVCVLVSENLERKLQRIVR